MSLALLLLMAQQVISGTVTVTTTATDNVGVAGVSFFDDGVLIAPEDTTAPYSIVWDTTTVPDGVHQITATARDAAGNVGMSTATPVDVQNVAPDTTPPTVDPPMVVENVVTVAGPAVQIAATATDNVGVTSVWFELDGALINGTFPTPPYGFDWDSTTVANGTYALTGHALDAAGNEGVSAPVFMMVAN